MEKEFSEGFLHDLADLLDYCKDNKTDNIDLHFVFGSKKLKMNIIFSIDEEEQKGELNNESNRSN